MTTFKKGDFTMSNNSVTTAASALSSTSITPCIVSRCGEFSIPLVRAGLDEGGNSNWRSFIPQGFITLSHARKLYGCGMSLQRLRYILTALDVENQSIHILKVDSGQKALIDAYEEKYVNIPEYWRLSGPLAEFLDIDRDGMTLTFEDETKGDDGIVTFDGLAPITVTVVNQEDTANAMACFVAGVREREGHPYQFVHPLFKGNGRGGRIQGFNPVKAYEQHMIDVVRRNGGEKHS